MIEAVLINPGEADSKRRSYIRVQAYPQLGLGYLSSVLTSAGIENKVIDLNVEKNGFKELILTVKRNHPVLVGIYVTSFSLSYVFRIIQALCRLRKLNSLHFRIIVGGPHITYLPESTFELGADLGFVGEAEASIVQIAEALKNPNPRLQLHRINGLICQDKRRAKRVSNRAVSLGSLDKLDKLPFPYRGHPSLKYFSPLHRGKITTLITSRGCCFDCLFCGLITKRKIQARSVQNVVSELKLLQQQGFDYIEIQDDFFTFNKQRVKELCNEMIKQRIKLEWGCETRADFLDYGLLRVMKKAGCRNVKIGIESGDEGIRRLVVGKNVTNKSIVETVDNCRKLGVEVIAYFMLGLPGEDKDKIKDTIQFAKKLRPDYAEFHLPIPIPGSRLFKIATDEKKIKKNAWRRVMLGGNIPVYSPRGLSTRELEGLRRKAYIDFYLSAGFLIRQLSFHNLQNLFARLRAGIAVLRNI